MRIKSNKGFVLSLGFFVLLTVVSANAQTFMAQETDALVAGETMAVAYSGFREGQYPDRGSGAVNPSAAEILEDLQILAASNFRLIRLYDAGDNSALTLKLIRDNELPIKVLLGMWLDAEISNHEGCPWLTEPIPDEVLAANVKKKCAGAGPGYRAGA